MKSLLLTATLTILSLACQAGNCFKWQAGDEFIMSDKSVWFEINLLYPNGDTLYFDYWQPQSKYMIKDGVIESQVDFMPIVEGCKFQVVVHEEKWDSARWDHSQQVWSCYYGDHLNSPVIDKLTISFDDIWCTDVNHTYEINGDKILTIHSDVVKKLHDKKYGTSYYATSTASVKTAEETIEDTPVATTVAVAKPDAVVNVTLKTENPVTLPVDAGVIKFTVTDENGWKWEYELIPADGDGVNFTGIANGYKVN